MADVEHIVKSLPVDDKLDQEVKNIESEGWQLIPGIIPVIVYHLMRVKAVEQGKAATHGAIGILKIDDTKVSILRDGKLVN